ncbi:MAG: LacI family DNA-binding transcriptional regulator [Bacteroidota bacterium]
MDSISPITLKDIAERLNISISTVSRALRNHPDVNAKTKRRVLQLAEELDYEPNELALSLLKGHSNIIAVIIPKVAYHLYATAIAAIENVIRLHGYTLVTAQTHESSEREIAAIKELIKNRVAGFIISLASETNEFSHFELIKRKSIPLVFFNRDCEEIITSRVVIDNVDAACKAVNHLLEMGYQKIAFLGASKLVQISNRRLQGYKRALQEKQISVSKKYIIHCDFEKESVMDATRKLLSLTHPPDAILAFSDQMAINAMLTIKEAGLKIPTDMGLMGFNNEPMDEVICPTLTSVHQPGYEMGKIAGELLLHKIKNKQSTQSELSVLSTKIVVRESTKKA